MKAIRYQIGFWAICFLHLNLCFPISASARNQPIMELQIKDGQLTAKLKEAELPQVLEKVSQLTGISIYMDKNLKSKITTSFSGLSIEEGLKRIIYPYSYVMLYSKGQGKGKGEGMLEPVIKEVRIFPSGQQPMASEYIKLGEAKSYLVTKEDKTPVSTPGNIPQDKPAGAAQEPSISRQSQPPGPYPPGSAGYVPWKKGKHLGQQREAIKSLQTMDRIRADRLREEALRTNDPQKWAEYYKALRSYYQKQMQENALRLKENEGKGWGYRK